MRIVFREDAWFHGTRELASSKDAKKRSGLPAATFKRQWTVNNPRALFEHNCRSWLSDQITASCQSTWLTLWLNFFAFSFTFSACSLLFHSYFICCFTVMKFKIRSRVIWSFAFRPVRSMVARNSVLVIIKLHYLVYFPEKGNQR